ncbi:hypothetical protein EAG_11220 [Camponotus floridanus]|uniref:Uncharacterized protein n=1 Tax=Camponotus floridanus TaxID=104421 RepID=E2A0M6_CAMFO|nr:hypothetical protein EAG_11220 [Camponotus floridanus]
MSQPWRENALACVSRCRVSNSVVYDSKSSSGRIQEGSAEMPLDMTPITIVAVVMVGYDDMRRLQFFNRVPKSRGAHRTGAPCDPTCWGINCCGIISRGSRESALNASCRMSFVPTNASVKLSLPASFRPKQLHRADFQRTWVSGSRSFTVVFVALSHCYLSDRGNVLALSPINPSPRDHWTHDIHTCRVSCDVPFSLPFSVSYHARIIGCYLQPQECGRRYENTNKNSRCRHLELGSREPFRSYLLLEAGSRGHVPAQAGDTL